MKKIIFKLFLAVCLFISGFYFLTMPNNTVEEYYMESRSILHAFLTPNPYSRPQKALKKVKGVVIHYTGNAGSTAINNRHYFENLKDTHTTSASSHFVVGLQGEIVQCIPLNEISYASNQRNKDTISIEVCHPDDTGQFLDETYDSLLLLVRSLMDTFDLEKSDIIRHYDVTGKICPKYFVDHPEAWEAFLESL